MKKLCMSVCKTLPGIALSVLIALLACFLESLLPIHVVGAAVIAMFIGMILNACFKKTKILAPGLRSSSFFAKRVRKGRPHIECHEGSSADSLEIS